MTREAAVHVLVTCLQVVMRATIYSFTSSPGENFSTHAKKGDWCYTHKSVSAFALITGLDIFNIKDLYIGRVELLYMLISPSAWTSLSKTRITTH